MVNKIKKLNPELEKVYKKAGTTLKLLTAIVMFSGASQVFAQELPKPEIENIFSKNNLGELSKIDINSIDRKLQRLKILFPNNKKINASLKTSSINKKVDVSFDGKIPDSGNDIGDIAVLSSSTIALKDVNKNGKYKTREIYKNEIEISGDYEENEIEGTGKKITVSHLGKTYNEAVMYAIQVLN